MTAGIRPTPHEVRRIGCTIAEFMARNAAGERFCVGCGWQPAGAFRRPIRIKGHCRACALKRDRLRKGVGSQPARQAAPVSNIAAEASALHRWVKTARKPIVRF